MEQNSIILVGTGHILERSVKEVEAVIDREEPDVVAVELCEDRYNALKGNVADFSIKEVIGGGNPFLILTHWLLAYVQRKMGAELGIEPGADMMAAIKKAEERGCEIALVDRPIQVTMQRFWKNMRFFEKLKMIFSIVFAITSIGSMGKGDTGKENEKLTIGGIGANKEIELDRITDDDVVTQLMEELREFSPGAATALLDERDAYIAGSLLELDQQTFKKSLTKNGSQASRRKIVAVVGAGHVAGIKNLLSHPELIPPKESLCSLPKRRVGINIKNLLGIGLGVALVIVLLAVFFSSIPFSVLLRAFLLWFIINAVLSAGGVVIARGHPLSALTAFSVSWLTSLNPFLAAGWFAGLTEAHFRKPTLEDARSMLNVESLRELMRNRLFKVVLVAALANVGSALGFWIGGIVVLHELGINIQDIWIGLKAVFI
ncbi:MAG: TraB/GumN family protein [Candidatus Syntrophoarchaeum sp.]|nr:TraB/GumN family protein [Candidatus Syntrophoarchaeum sp.]